MPLDIQECLLGSISPTFYEQLLRTQIPKAQKDTADLPIFLGFWGQQAKKAGRKHVAETNPMCFYRHISAIYHSFACMSLKRRKTVFFLVEKKREHFVVSV